MTWRYVVQKMPVLIEQETPEIMLKEILSHARQHGLSTYDASYFEPIGKIIPGF
jgi:hypothetical protein